MPHVEHTTYHITMGNANLRSFITQEGEFWIDLPDGNELHLRNIGMSESFERQVIEALAEGRDDIEVELL